jgi:hypothetical protein|tara:strand:- start:1150 stop:1560 length:411 start_codon:yes stop_codon:yes gene_type:complete
MSGKGFMKNKGFSMIPNQVIWDEDISNDAKLLFCYLRSLSEKYRTLRNKTLLYKLGISLNTLQNCKAELIKNGYLKVIRKTSANKYELAIPNKVVLPYPEFGQQTTQNLGSIKKSNTNIYNNKGLKGFKRLKGFKP